jgi:L-threonylcarbamoyladenylate synthase
MVSMLRLHISATDPEPEILAQAVGVLREGGVVAYPTDTLYGLAVDPRRDDAIEQLFALKERDRGAAIPLIAADTEQARAAARLGPREMRLAAAFWPGPLAVVVPAQPALSRSALSEGTVAIRVPAHPVARALAAAFGFALTATSANRSGLPPAESAERVAETLGDVAFLLDGGPSAGGAPSTIVRLTDDGPVLVRAGAVAWDRVLRSLE